VSFNSKLVAASGHRELAGDRGEDDFNFISEPNQNRDGDDRNKSQYQCVLDKGLAFFLLSAVKYSFIVHQFTLSFSKLKSARR